MPSEMLVLKRHANALHRNHGGDASNGLLSILLEDVASEAIEIAVQELLQNDFPLSRAIPIAKRCVDQNLSSYLTNAKSADVRAKRTHGPEPESKNAEEKIVEKVQVVELNGLSKAIVRDLRAFCVDLLKDDGVAIKNFMEPSSPRAPYQYSVNALLNLRRKMEDRHALVPNLAWLYPDIKDADTTAIFAVFDGHGGDECAAYARAHCIHHVVHSVHYPNDVEAALVDGFETCDEHLLKLGEIRNWRSGATAVCAIVKDNTVFVAWAGDSRAMIVERQGVRRLTEPLHDTKNKDELNRIEKVGGIVLNIQGQDRVNGLLNITRALGDSALKPTPLTAKPETVKSPLVGNEICLILASDGLFDGHDWNQCGNVVREYLTQEPISEYPNLAKYMVGKAKEKTSDNVTVIVVFLKPLERLEEIFRRSE